MIDIFLNRISGMILGIPTFIFSLNGIASLTFELASGPEALKKNVVRFVIKIPVIGDWFIAMIEAVHGGVCKLIKS